MRPRRFLYHPGGNPDYRGLDGQVGSKQGHLTRKLAAFSTMNLKSEIEPKKVLAFEQKKAKLQEQIEDFTQEVAALKTRREAAKHRLTLAELPEAECFKQLSTQSKHLIDTIKMVARRWPGKGCFAKTTPAVYSGHSIARTPTCCPMPTLEP